VTPHAPEYLLWRQRLEDGECTTVYAVRHARATTRVRVVCFPQPRRLDVWCADMGFAEAVVGGFFLRDPYRPLGDVWVAGRPLDHEPIAHPHGARRSCLVVEDTLLHMAARADAPERPRGDLLQAGPLLMRDGAITYCPGDDAEGFSAGAGQFDSDITDGRHPRAAIGVSREAITVVACDGRRTGVDAGLDLLELARIMAGLGCDDAINLDGGGSTTLVHRGHLLNRPYSSQDQPAPESRAVVTALTFVGR
jgi:hypothetical protein